MPREADILSRLSKTGNKYIVPYRGHSVDRDNKFIRLYMGFAKWGDLNSAIFRRQDYQYLSKYGLPEPYIWYAAYCLASALQTLEEGTDVYGEKPNFWNGIIHLDIKPGNIVLTEPTPRNDSSGVGSTQLKELNWPNLQLIDFGLSRELGAGVENPEDFLGLGNEPYVAPEVHDPQPETEGQRPILITCKANVFQLGHILYCLMIDEYDGNPGMLELGSGRPWAWAARRKREVHKRGGDWLHQPGSANMPPSEEDTKRIEFPEEYSNDLKRFVRKALSFDPKQRPSPASMMRGAKRQLAYWVGKGLSWRQKDDCNDPFYLHKYFRGSKLREDVLPEELRPKGFQPKQRGEPKENSEGGRTQRSEIQKKSQESSEPYEEADTMEIDEKPFGKRVTAEYRYRNVRKHTPYGMEEDDEEDEEDLDSSSEELTQDEDEDEENDDDGDWDEEMDDV
jgi:serine/threonine protein kinase